VDHRVRWIPRCHHGLRADERLHSSLSPDHQCPLRRLRSVGLDPQTVYSVRDASIDRPSLHIDLDDGTVAFTEDICGRITGAFFEGEGEIRLRPEPSRARIDALFTGMAILEEQFASAYFRFNDDTAEALMPFLRPALGDRGVTKKWGEASRNLAESDAPRLLLDFSHFFRFFRAFWE